MKIPFLISLHRPFNKRLKTSVWVCEFVENQKGSIKSSEFNTNFFLYLVEKLHKQYEKTSLEDYHGIPTSETINQLYLYLNELHYLKKVDLIEGSLKNRNRNSIEKKIYSTYKACSYYVNLAKDKFSLISAKNKLTVDGSKLVSYRSISYFKLSKKESGLILVQVLNCDFLLFITQCLFTKLQVRIGNNALIHYQFLFLDEYYSVSHFNFTSVSLRNYKVVRDYWIDSLKVLDSNNNIRKFVKEVIAQNNDFQKWFTDVENNFIKFKKGHLKDYENYLTKKDKFLKLYNSASDNSINLLDFVNLYEIKEGMNMSYDRFNEFLNRFYQREKGEMNIFFSNIVNSIDRRARFKVDGVPVFKIKIKK